MPLRGYTDEGTDFMGLNDGFAVDPWLATIIDLQKLSGNPCLYPW